MGNRLRALGRDFPINPLEIHQDLRVPQSEARYQENVENSCLPVSN